MKFRGGKREREKEKKRFEYTHFIPAAAISILLMTYSQVFLNRRLHPPVGAQASVEPLVQECHRLRPIS
jgi:hypothetical protein